MTPTFAVERCDSVNGHVYSTPAGPLPSVTTILSETRPRSRVQRIQGAVARRGREAALASGAATTRGAGSSLVDAARARGDAVHSKIEAALTDPFWPAALSDGGDGWWASARSALELVDEPLLVEAAVASIGHGFAGTVDAVVKARGRTVLLDWKTAGSKRKREWIEDYELQLGAYVVGLRETYDLDIQNAAVVLLYEGAEPDVFDLDRPRLEWAWARFRIRLAAFLANRPCMPCGVSGIVGA